MTNLNLIYNNTSMYKLNKKLETSLKMSKKLFMFIYNKFENSSIPESVDVALGNVDISLRNIVENRYITN